MVPLSVLTKIDLYLLPLLLLASFLAALDKVRTTARSTLPVTSIGTIGYLLVMLREQMLTKPWHEHRIRWHMQLSWA